MKKTNLLKLSFSKLESSKLKLTGLKITKFEAPKLSLLALNLCIALAGFANSAQAEEPVDDEYTFMDSVKDGKNLTSFRLRYEHVEQDGLGPAGTTAANIELKDAEALTLRSLVGWQTAPYNNFSFAGQLTGVSKLMENYNDRKNNATDTEHAGYAVIVDPEHYDVNQLYVEWTGIKNTRFRLGRQQVNLDNVRFIGDIAFRQLMQVFDGVSVLNKSIPDTEVYLAHYGKVSQINADERTGDLDIANVRYRISPTEFLVGYGYFSNMDNLGFGNAWFGPNALNNNGKPNLTADQSNKILGLRLDGVHPFNPNLRALYTAEYAKQTDYSGGDKRIDAHYYKIGGGVGIDAFNVRIDQELLSSNDSKYAFQTPFGTNHLFQGWVDKFLVTPRQGIQDTFITATYKFADILFFADYHVFKSDENFNTVGSGTARNGDKYGTEWNVAATYNWNKNIMTKFEYGQYNEDDNYAPVPNTPNNVAGNRNRIRDTEKLWLTAMYTF